MAQLGGSPTERHSELSHGNMGLGLPEFLIFQHKSDNYIFM